MTPLEQVLRNGSVTSKVLTDALGISQPSLSRRIRDLAEAVLAKEAGPLAMRCTIAGRMLAQVQGLNERIQRLA